MSKYKPKQFSPHIYPEWGELISDLDADKTKEVMMAICQYPNYNPDIGVWRFIKSQIDKDYEEFIARNEAHRSAIKNYWDNKSKQEETKDNKCSLLNNKSKQEENKGEPITYNVKRITNNINKKKNIKENFSKYGEFQNVCLEPSYYEKLRNTFGEQKLNYAIERLDAWLDNPKQVKKRNCNHRSYFKSDSWVWGEEKKVNNDNDFWRQLGC